MCRVFPVPTKIVFVVVVVVVVPSADVIAIKIANNVRRGPGDANPTLILLIREAADRGGPT